MNSRADQDFPEAEVHDGGDMGDTLRRNSSRLWIVTGICLIVAVILFASTSRNRGTLISVRFQQGHGIKPGDVLRHRGIEVGEVQSVKLDDDLDTVVVNMVLESASAGLAREGSRFWIERPRLSLARVSGLETVVGAKYLGVLPGPATAPPQFVFDGDESPLLVLDTEVREIEIHFRDGHGLQVGDELKHRGIVVGEVSDVVLNKDLSGVAVSVRLVESAQRLARAGSLFWIERPDVSLTGIRGLETIVGGRYLAVLPGPDEAELLTSFTGLEVAPTTTERSEGGLEVTLESIHRRGVRPGAPVLYRGHKIGQIGSVGLSPDASRVEARAYIEPAFKRIIRVNTVFWSTSGVKANFSITGGFDLSAETLETIAAGGVSLATPDDPGKPVSTGHRFTILSKDDEGFDESTWTAWQPHIALGSIDVPDATMLPQPVRVALAWKEKRLGLTRSRQREGWVLPLSDRRLLCPADLLIPPESALDGKAALQLVGQEIPIKPERIELHGKLAILRLDEPLTDVTVWPTERLRKPPSIEEAFALAESAESGFPIPANRLTSNTGVDEWDVAPSFSISPQLHGACVVSRHDAAVLGMIVVDRGIAHIALAPDDLDE
ncbi:MAG: MCE family protein [Planctomycetaceae bacterium]|nr:MCE family protein [Planctomycetales bacterium]MCB9926768.1 MCE family protein [Planctomycetaceae bacterium]